MNSRFKRKIENDFPYPIASEFRLLNTEEYLEPDGNRLKQILKTTESTIHLLALISVIDLFENQMSKPIEIPDSYKNEFAGRFTRTSFGKWVALFRETIKVFKTTGKEMFIQEFPDYFIKGEKSETEAQKAFNKLTSIRNHLAHLKSVPTKKEIETLCVEAEELLETILHELDFIIDYPFLYVNNVNVNYFRLQTPDYQHSFSEIIGNTAKFSAYKKKLNSLVNSPAVIITKEKEEDFLNLDPLIIYSDEGEKHIPDIFLYTDWNKKNKVEYKPVWNGGVLNLPGTAHEKENIKSLLKFFEFFANEDIFLRFEKGLILD